MSANPVAAERRNRPDVDQQSFAGTRDTGLDRREPRHLFSPFLTINTFYDPCGFNAIRRGIIRAVVHYDQPCRNTEEIKKAFNVTVLQSYDVGDDLFARDAATVAEGLIRTHGKTGDEVPTGLIALHALQGIDPVREYGLLELVNDALWPENYETAAEHRAFLEKVDLTPIFSEFGAEIADRVERCRADIFNVAIPGSEAYCRLLYNNLSLELKANVIGTGAHAGAQAIGYRGEASPAERQACRWLHIPEPQRPVNAVEGIGSIADLVALTTQQMQQNAEMMQMMMTKVLGDQSGGSPDNQAATLATLSQMMETNRLLSERLLAKETIVVPTEEESAVTDEVVTGKAKAPASKTKSK